MRSIAIIQFTIKLNDLKNAIVIVELEKCGCKQNGRRRGGEGAMGARRSFKNYISYLIRLI